MNAAIVNHDDIVPFALVEVEFQSAFIPVRIVNHKKCTELVPLRQTVEVISNNVTDGINLTMLSIKIMAQNVFFCPVVEIGVEGFVNCKYARHKMLFAGFSPNAILGQRTEPWIGYSHPSFYIQSIPRRPETSLADHIDFETYEFGNGKIFE